MDNKINQQDLMALLPAVEQILIRGNTAEIKRRKDELIVLEVPRKIRASKPIK